MSHVEHLPLIFDHHNHLSFSAMLSTFPYVGQYTSKEDLLAYLRSQIAPNDNLSVIVGLRNDVIKLAAADLRSFPPLILINHCLHGFTCNAKAANLLREAHLEPYPQTARQAEKEMARLFLFFSKSLDLCLSTEQLIPAFKRCIHELRQAGLYGAEDMMYTLPYACDAKLCGDFKIKTRRPWCESEQANVIGTKPPIQLAPVPTITQVHSKLQNDKLTVTAAERKRVKLFADGALGAGTAALSAGYIQGGHPVLIYEDSELADILQKCIVLETDTAIHTIGDRAIDQVLRILQSCYPLPTGCSFKLRLEHCQFITLAQARKCKELGVKLCMQPNFNDDSSLYANKLSPTWCRYNNPLRMLIDQVGFVPGQDLLWGSDGLPSGLAPALQSALFPTQPEQALTIEEILAGYSANPDFGYQEYIIDELNQSVTLKQ